MDRAWWIWVDMRPKITTRQLEGVECAVGNVDRAIAELAETQRGVVTRGQLLEIGMKPGAIKRRLRIGRLHGLHKGVYLVGHAAAPEGAREMAAVLVCGPRAVLSHRSAAYVWKLLPYPATPTPVDITLVRAHAATRGGIRVHRVAKLSRRDVRILSGLPITIPARTVLDLAGIASPDELDRAFAEAQVQRVVDARGLADQIARNPGRAGVRALRALIDAGPAPTRSEAERRFLRLVRSAGLPEPQVNSRVGRYEVDFLWPDERLVVEIDGFAVHGTRRAFERDRQRDAALAASGYTVLRVTWRQIVAETQVVARLAASLAVRSW
jgi:very-short-patch-repair endonuclease